MIIMCFLITNFFTLFMFFFQNLMVIRALVKMTTQEFTGAYGQHQLITDTINEKSSTPASGNRTGHQKAKITDFYATSSKLHFAYKLYTVT